MTQIATLGGDIPADLLAATGRYAGPIGWNVDRPTPTADQWIESSFAPWVRSVLEDWAAGAFDHLETVIFSRGDDNAQRLYYYVCELRARGLIGGPEPLIFDVARIRRPTSLARTIRGVRHLAEQLGLDDAALERGIGAVNAQRSVTTAIPAGRICLLSGTAPPDDRLHAMITALGWTAIGETQQQLWSNPGPMVAEKTGDAATAIGQQVHAQGASARAFTDRAAVLVARAMAVAAKAVILWFTEEEEGLVWHAPAQTRALAEAGIPVVLLTRCDWAARDGVDARIAEFLNGLPQ
ncbi:MAG: hypothetical protein RL367_1295 [Pseudomonadota bacterium]|jgi:hypothetical protein